jgi:hypothetical protein
VTLLQRGLAPREQSLKNTAHNDYCVTGRNA